MDWMKITAIAFVALSGIGITLIIMRKDLSFFNVLEVIQAQHQLLKDDKLHRFAFYILPIFLSFGLAVLYVPNDAFISSMVTVVCMLLSILLAALAIIASNNVTNVVNEDQRKSVSNVIRETVFLISYAAYLSVFLLIYLLVLFAMQVNALHPILATVLTGVGYYVFALIILTLLIIIKRIWKLKEPDLK